MHWWNADATCVVEMDSWKKNKPGMNVMSFYTEIAQKQTVDSDDAKLLVIQELFK